MKENEIDKIDEVDDNIFTTSESNPLILDQSNKIFDSQDTCKTFDCEIINQGRLDKIYLIINMYKKTIEVKLSTNDKNIEDKKEILNNEENFIHLKTIDQIDFVSFLSQEDIKEEKINDIRNKIISNKNNKNIEQDNLKFVL